MLEISIERVDSEVNTMLVALNGRRVVELHWRGELNTIRLSREILVKG